MLLNFTVRIPDAKNIYTHTIRGQTYVDYVYERTYDPVKKYTQVKRTTIGRQCPDDPSRMQPNENFLVYFPDEEIPDLKQDQSRSLCLRIGAFIVLRKIVQDYELDEMISQIIGDDAGLFLDFALYEIISEDNAAQYYPDYAYNHPLMTEKMRIYSDSKISDFLHDITIDQSIRFLNMWNEKRDHREKIYISYDSTNKDCQAGDIELAEPGNNKSHTDNPIINYAVAYDRNNRIPLFYENYPGSIVDIAQLQYMLEAAKGYGYRNAGFILDRGYFSKANIKYMDGNGYDFIIMVKGKKALVREIIRDNEGTFEKKRSCTIKKYLVNGTTVKRKLFEDDNQDRYFHLFYSSTHYSQERRALEIKLNKMNNLLKKMEGKAFRLNDEYLKYFEPVYNHEGTENEVFLCAKEKTDVIDEEIGYCGYFAIVSSKKMSAEDAYMLYKSRDYSEKLFRGTKSYLGSRTERVYSTSSEEAKVFIEFIASIIRNRFYTCLTDEAEKMDSRPNYMTVPKAVKELEKIEMVARIDGEYRLSRAVTKTQRTILKAFEITAGDIKKQAVELNEKIRAYTAGGTDNEKDGSADN